MRRIPLRALVLAGALALAACKDTGGAHPLEIAADSACALDGMLLADFPGPKAQMHFAGRDAPEFFCDPMELVSLYLKPEQARAVAAMYVQDMARADWDAPRGNWIDAKAAFYVLGSRKHGAMGPTLVTFAERGAADAFAAKEGGKVLAFDELKADMVALDGGALHDKRM